MRRGGPFLALLALLAVGLVAGCGDNAEKNAYVDEINAAQQRFLEGVQAVQTESGTATDPSEVGSLIAAMIDEVEIARDEIAAIEPPSDVAALHAELVEILDGFASDLESTSADLSSNDPAAIVGAVQELQQIGSEAGGEADRVIAEINSTLQG